MKHTVKTLRLSINNRTIVLFCLMLIAVTIGLSWIIGGRASTTARRAVASSPVASEFSQSGQSAQPLRPLRPLRSEAVIREFAVLGEKAAETGLVRVIVRLNLEFEPAEESRIQNLASPEAIGVAQDRLLNEIAGFDATSVKRFRYVPFVAMRVNAAGLESLRASDRVAGIQEDGMLMPTAGQLSSRAQAAGNEAMSAGQTGASLTGNGQTVVVIDTGVDKMEQRLAGKVIDEACYSTNDPNQAISSLCPGGVTATTLVNSALPCSGGGVACEQGTRLAGLIVGRGNDGNGVAPEAKVIAMQIFSKIERADQCPDGSGSCIAAFDSDLVSALERTYELRGTHSIAAVTMSLGRGRYGSNCDEAQAATKAMIDLLRGAGIATIVSSGSGGYSDALSAPACISTAISVGSTTEVSGTGERVDVASNSAETLKLLAPGGQSASRLLKQLPQDGGNSMAAPRVAAAFALAREKAPAASVVTIATALAETGDKIVDQRNGLTRPRIRIDRALDAINSTLAVPVKPEGLFAVASSSTQIDLVWNDTANETSYKLQRKTSISSINWVTVATPGANTTSYQDTGLTPARTYYYQLIAVNSDGDSLASDVVRATTQAVPLPPTNLSATVISASQINLVWADNATNETSYKVRRGTVSGGPYIDVATLPANTSSFQNTGLVSGTTYYYTIAAVNGGSESLPSNESGGATPEIVPAAPSGLAASVISPTVTDKLNLNWADNSNNETGFRVERRTATGDFTQVGTILPANTNTYQSVGLIKNTQYFFRVIALNFVGDSPASNIANATTPDTLPTAPSGLVATVVSASQINLSWTDNADTETGYKVRRSLTSGGPYTDVATLPARTGTGTVTYEDKNLVDDTTYYYKVAAVNSGGEAVSNESNAKTLPLPDPPTGLVATGITASKIGLSWNDNSTIETGYKIRRSQVAGGPYTEVGQVGANATGTATFEDTGLTDSTRYYYIVVGINANGESESSNESSALTKSLPTKPTSVVATADSASQITLTWNDPTTDETGFEISRRSGSGAFALLFMTSSNATGSATYVDTDRLSGSQAYTYQVVTVDLNGKSIPALSNEVTTPAGAPAPPSGLTAAAASGSSIQLTWIDNSATETEFRVERKNGADWSSPVTFSVGANISNYLDSGLTANTTYEYRVLALTAAQNGNPAYTSPPSNTASATPPLLPAAPTALAATTVSATRIDLGWTDNSVNESGFRIRRKAGAGDFSQIATVPTGAAAYSDTSVGDGTEFTFSVTAYNVAGDSTAVTGSATTPLPAPTGLLVAPINATTLQLTWTDNTTNESNFRIERGTAPGGPYTVIAPAVSKNATSYQDSTGLTVDTNYYYRVTAYNAIVTSDRSGEAFSKLERLPVAPGGLNATATSPTAVQLTWTDNSSNETGFRISRRTGASTFATIGTVTTTSFQDTGLSEGTEYFYQVTAFNISGDSTTSTEDSVITRSNPASNLTVTIINSSTLGLSWTDNSATEIGYSVRRKTASTGYAEVAQLPANATTYTDSGLTSNTEYSYRVFAINGGGLSAASEEVSTTPPTLPAAASTLALTVNSSTKITLTWVDNSTNESGFRIRRRSVITADWVTIRTVGVGVVTWEDTTVSENTRYYYTVTAFNSGGEAVPSNEVNGLTPVALPNAPSGLTATTRSNTQISLAWVDNSTNESAYKVERKSSVTAFTEIASIDANRISYEDLTGLAGITYTYRVTALNSAGTALSNEATTTTGVTPPTPTELLASVTSSSQVLLTWKDGGSGELGFRVRRRILQTGTDTVAGIADPTSGTSGSFTDTGLKSGTTYYYSVTSYDNVGESLPTPLVFARTLDLFPEAPTAVRATAVSASRVDVSWTDNSDNETSFKVQRKTVGGIFADVSNELGPDITTYQDTTGLAPQTTYIYRVVVTNVLGIIPSISEATVTTPIGVPSAPPALTATVVSSFQVNLTWSDSATTETGYRIYRKKGVSGAFNLYQSLAANAVSFQDVGLEEGETYAYRVVAFNSAGESPNVEATVTMPMLPNQPTVLVATFANANRINLSWTDNATNETGFRIFRRVGAGSFSLLTSISANTTASGTYSDAGLTPNTTYTYYLFAFNDGGSSDQSNNATTTTPIIPPVPTGLIATPIDDQSIQLDWTFASAGQNGHSGFKILRRQTIDGPYTEVTPTSPLTSSSTQYLDTGLVSLRTYRYVVVAKTPTDESVISNEASALTTDGPPDSPTGLTVTIASPTRVTLNWNDNSANETSFKIERKDGLAAFAPLVDTLPSVTTYDDTTVSSGINYTYRVKAYNSNSPATKDSPGYTNEVAVTPPVGAPSAPTTLAAGVRTPTSINLTWVDNSSDEASFVLSRKSGIGSYVVIATLPANTTSYNDTGLTEGTIYNYSLLANNAAGESAPVELLGLQTLPLGPTALAVTIRSFTSATLNWVDNSATEDTYVIKRKVGAGGSYSVLAGASLLSSNTTSFIDTTLTSGTAYFYKVFAVQGVDESASSNEVSVTLPSQPTAPSSLVAATNRTTPVSQIDLTWTDNSNNETGFRIERKAGTTGTWATVITLAANVTSYQNTGLISGTVYYYRVLAVNAGGASNASNESFAATDGYPPNAPTELVATTVSGTQINLTWKDNSDNEIGFRIQRRQIATGTPGSWLTVATIGANNLATASYQNTNLIPGRTYAYRVVSYNNDGDSTSNESEATTSLTVPAAPTELTATVISAFQINLAWFDNSGTETGYRIRRKASLSGAYTTLIELAENTRSYSDTGLTANTTYYYQVIAFNTLGDSLPSNDASGRTLLPPTAPSNLVATAASSTQINLTWTDNSTNETGFRIQRKTGVSGVWSEIATVAANVRTYQNSGLTPGVTYIYRVTSFNAVTDSAATAEASATTPVGIPSPPTNLQAIVVSFSQINLTWTDVSGNETGFLIRRKIGSGGTYADLATVPANTSSYQDTGLSAAVTYFYTVSAVSNNGNSAPSNEVSGTTTSGGSGVPAAPSGLVATATSSSQINLTWIDNASNETGFKIRRKAGVDGTWAQVATAGLNSTTYSDTSLNSSQTYYYTVTATNAVGDSPLSNEANATTQTGATTPIAPPGNLQVTALTPSSTQLNWIDTSAAESGFRIQRKTEVAGSWANITTVPANATSYQDSGLLSNATYYYRVTSFNSTAESDPSNEHAVSMPVFDFDTVSNGQAVIGAVARNASKYYRIYVPSGATELLVETSGNNNANLYVQFGKQPTLTSNCRSEGTSSAEQCRLTTPGAGDWHIEVRGNSSTTSNFTLTATYQGGGTVTAPTAPTGLTAATVSSSQVNLTWTDTSNNETNFRIRRRLGSSTTWALIATIGPNLNTYQDTGLTAGTTYSYYVTAFNVAGESANSNESSATTLNSTVTAPAAPSNLTAAAASTTQINLSWTDNSSNETGFRIKRRASGATTSAEIGTVLQNVLSYQDSSLTPGTTYFYTVVAFNTGGTSADSNEAGATTQSVNPTAPAGPSGLVAVAASAVQINLGWTDNSTNETGFRIRRKIGSNGAYSDLATVNANVSSYQDLGLIPGVTYYYVVLAFNANGNSVDSNEASANTVAPAPTVPAAPGGLVTTVISSTQINLSWTDNSTNETGFRIRRKTGSTGTYADLGTVVQNVTSYQDTGLTQGTVYFYQVFASNAAGDSAGSNEASGTTTSDGGSTLPAIPAGLLVTATSITSVSLSWNDASTNETGFRIQRKMGTNGIWAEVGTVGANVTLWQDSSLVSNAVYFYKIASFNLIGESNYTNEMSVTIPVSAFTAIANGQTVSGSAKRNQAIYYRLSIPEGARDLVVESNSTPVTSLFVRYDKQPTQYAYNCNSEANNATQSCKLLTPIAGDWHIQVLGNTSTTSNFTMTASYQSGSGDVAPTAPSSLTGTPVSTTQINLSWTDGASNETGFRIRRKNGITGTYAVIATLGSNVTIYQDTGLTAGTTYFYQVVAYNSVAESGSSNEFSTTTLTDSLTVPSAPSGLFATAVSSTQISLSWTDGANNETGFRVRRKTGSSGTYAIVATPGQNLTSYQDTGLTAGTTYFYQVVAYNSAGDSGSSNEASATTLATSITVPISPSNLAATVVSSTQINLSWTDGSSNETGFRVRRKTGSTGTYAVVSTLGQNITSYQDTGLTAGTTYFYQVVAYNSAGDSVSSNEVSATTTSSGGGGGVGTPTAPASLTATTLSTSIASLKWTDSSTNETGFRVQRKTGVTGSWSDVATLGANVTTWQDSGLLSNGTYFYRVVAFNANGDSAPSEEKSITAPISSFTILNNGVTVSNSVTRSASRYYLITVPAGAADLTVETTGTFDSNLYVRFDRQPTLVSYNCRSVGTASTEKCLIAFPAAGDWHIQVLGNSITTSNFTLQATYTEGSKISPVPSPK